MTAKGATSPAEWVDPDDAPEWTDAMFEQADLYDGDRLVRAGKPPTEPVPGYELVLLREGIVRRFRETGPGWQARVEEALTAWLAAEPDRH